MFIGLILLKEMSKNKDMLTLPLKLLNFLGLQRKRKNVLQKLCLFMYFLFILIMIIQIIIQGVIMENNLENLTSFMDSLIGVINVS